MYVAIVAFYGVANEGGEKWFPKAVGKDECCTND
jgi:hypothetical protein